MAKWPGVMGAGGFDYVQDTEPSDPVEGDEWYDTVNDDAQVYDGADWHGMTVGDFSELSGKVTTGQITDGDVTPLKLSFDPASQTELDNHSATAGAHHSRSSPPYVPANPADVQYGNEFRDYGTTSSASPNGGWAATGDTVTLDFSGIPCAKAILYVSASGAVGGDMGARLVGQTSGTTFQVKMGDGGATKSSSTTTDVSSIASETFDVEVHSEFGDIDPVYHERARLESPLTTDDIA